MEHTMQFNPFSDDFYDDPYDTYRWLRENAPAYQNEQYGFWALSRFDDVIAGTFDATLGLGFMPASLMLTRYPATGALLEPLGVQSIFRALPDQLGLRLDDATMPGDVLVIDKAERPE